jgi:hypothetical protein
MADTSLTVAISADINGLTEGLRNAKGELISFDKSVSKLEEDLKDFQAQLNNSTSAKSIVNLNKAITETKAKISDLKKLSDASAAGLGGSMAKGADKASYALLNLGRVAQDAPFGFVGIQNNLNPLLESFQRLKAETGTVGGSLKALASSLIGPAGLGVALSVVGAGILFYQQYLSKSKKATEEAAKSNEDYAKSLGDVKQEQLVGAQNAQSELTNLKVLFDAYQNANLPLKERKEAYKDLQDKYPAYFKNLAFEETATDKTKDAYDRLTGAILATARARAAEALITENSKKQLENEQRIADLEADRLGLIGQALTAAQKLDALNKNATLQTKASESFASRAANIAQTQLDAESAQAKKIDEINALKEANIKLGESSLRLEKDIFEQIKKGADLTGKVGKEGKAATIQKTETLDKLAKTREKDVRVTNPFGIGPAPEIDKNGFKTLKALPKDYSLLIAQNKLLKDSFESTFGSIGEAIGKGITEGSNLFEVLGQTILSAVGDILVQFGKLTIAAGVAAVGLSQALLHPFNPASGALAIAAGVALVAIGSAVKAFSSGSKGSSAQSGSGSPRSVPAFANGVTGFSGGMALVGERGPELVTLGRGSNVVTNENVSRFMGNRNQNIILEGNLGISMGQLVFALRREEKLMGRTS